MSNELIVVDQVGMLDWSSLCWLHNICWQFDLCQHFWLKEV